MDRIEQRQDGIEHEVRSLSATVLRMETNQEHAVELNKLRFDALDMGIKAVTGQLESFIKRIEGMLTGEVETVQSRESRALVADYQTWRRWVDRRINMLLGGLALVAFVCGLVVPTILGWFKP
jgi:hypothetical protein